MKKTLLYITFLTLGSLNSQSLDFLNLPIHARQAALGSVHISHFDDVGYFLVNPAILSDTLHGQVNLSHQFHIGGIQHSNLTGGYSFKNFGTAAMGLQFINYGELEGYDDTGRETGTFNAYDLAIAIGASHQVNQISFGLNLKYAQSIIGVYQNRAILVDLASVFKHPSKDLQLAISLTNFGYNFTNKPLPIDLKAALSFHPTHMPLRFNVTTYGWLQKWKIRESGRELSTMDHILKSFVIGIESTFSKTVTFQAAYNHRKRTTYFLNDGSGLAGFSFGTSIHTKYLGLNYSMAINNIARPNHYLTLKLPVASYLKKGIM